MSSPRPSIVQPAALGLSAGLIIGALYLAIKAILLSSSTCAVDASVEDCNLELELAGDMSRFFYFFAVGLMLTGVGVFVIFRPREKGAA